nr:N-6 DNA methylase [uncultured Oscillibacter sp.]
MKQEEGQYFTPKQVIQAAIKLMDLSLDDMIIDPACGTGGFIIQCLIELKDRYPSKEKEISRWAQLHIYGIDKRGFESVTIGELCDAGIISVTGGHGSPSNDLRNGTIPYVKVSDIRNMRILSKTKGHPLYLRAIIIHGH